MPVKVKNKLTGEIMDTSIGEVNTKYQLNLWDIIYQRNIVQIYHLGGIRQNDRFIHGKYEREEAEQLLIQNPTYRFEVLPDIGDLLPLKMPIKYVDKINKPIIIPWRPILKNDYIKYILTGLIVLILWFFIYPYLKNRFNHP